MTSSILAICSWCKEVIKDFKDKKSETEFKISGLCQECQDKTFKSSGTTGENQLSIEAINEFKELYFKEYGIKITNALAIDMGTRLIKLVKIVFGPNLPKTWPPKNIDTTRSNKIG